MYPRLLKIDPKSKKSFFLLGPRGTGKTAWIKANFPTALYFDLLDLEVYGELQAHPKTLEHSITANFNDWIVIDEVQKLPELLNEVHRLIEHNRYRFILTGSSARSLRRKGVNLLAGRALIYQMHPLTVIELGDDFRLDFSLQYGFLPSVYSEHDPAHFLKTYVQTYLKEEVLQEGLTRRLNIFMRFLETASFSQGSLLNMTSIAREIGVSSKTVAEYFAILEDLLISFRLPVFSRRAKRQLVAHSKFYFFDVGVYRSLRPMGVLDSIEEITGICVETLFIQQLRAMIDYLKLDYKLYFWRTRHGVEIDFIAYGSKGLLAFEVKSSKRIHEINLSGLKAFKEDYPMAQLYCIYMGEKSQYYGDITVLPLVEALRQLSKILDNQNPI